MNITRTLQMVFEDDGYHVYPAYSSAEAIAYLQNGHQIDAVITDLNMEKEDIGLEVARAAQARKPAPIVVICTGYSSLKNSREAMEMHVDFLAQKPVDLDELKGALHRLMARRSAGRRRG